MKTEMIKNMECCNKDFADFLEANFDVAWLKLVTDELGLSEEMKRRTDSFATVFRKSNGENFTVRYCATELIFSAAKSFNLTRLMQLAGYYDERPVVLSGVVYFR